MSACKAGAVEGTGGELRPSRASLQAEQGIQGGQAMAERRRRRAAAERRTWSQR